MKILITGGCGFVGSNLAIFLKNYFNSVSSLDNLYRKGSLLNLKRINKKGIKNYKIDIKNEKKIFQLPKFDLIIDCCAETSVEKSRLDLNSVKLSRN
jgi:CDP-paratose 2-epimerase